MDIVFKKRCLKSARLLLRSLDATTDFVEISTMYNGNRHEVRISGKKDATGKFAWDINRVVNKSLIPSDVDPSHDK